VGVNSTREATCYSTSECTEEKNYLLVRYVGKYFQPAAIEMTIKGDIIRTSHTSVAIRIAQWNFIASTNFCSTKRKWAINNALKNKKTLATKYQNSQNNKRNLNQNSS
jgi:hypothetical protein